MPVYEYVCKNADCKIQRFDRLRPFEDASLPQDCPECGIPAERGVSVPSRPRVPGGTGAARKSD
jgi:putative FmdB family regulatory protein